MAIKYPPVEERLWAKVDKSGECWLWTGATAMGYGHLQRNGKAVKVHRLSYELEYGEIPEGMDVCHTCDNPLCVRPTHLWLGTHKENMHDRDRKGRNHAPKGERSPKSKLMSQQVLEIRRLANQGYSQPFLGRRFNVSSVSIYKIVNRLSWKHI
jgi:hypothetical protein